MDPPQNPAGEFTAPAGYSHASVQASRDILAEAPALLREAVEGMTEIIFQAEPDLQANEFIDVLVRSTLAARRPIDDVERMSKMLANADVICTARCDGLLVGIARAITDFCYCTYLADLAVDQKYQGQGIGRRLLHAAHQAAGLNTQLILLAAPAAETYYPHAGLSPHNSCWLIPSTEPGTASGDAQPPR
jgi:GNAT superfamily N-acetyltransferase